MATLHELNEALDDIPTSSLNVTDPLIDGSFLHYLTQTANANEEYLIYFFKIMFYSKNILQIHDQRVSWRMVYSLSNAGLEVNWQDSKGNTALHLAYMRGHTQVGFNLIEVYTISNI